MDRASGYGPEGHGFESSSARQNKVHPLGWTLFFLSILPKRIRKGRFAARQIATFRGTVAKSVGVSAVVPPSEAVQVVPKNTVRDRVDFIFCVLKEEDSKSTVCLAFLFFNAII